MEVKTGTWTEKKGLAQMLKGGVIMDVVTRRAGQDRRGRRAPSRSWRWSACRPISARDGGVARMATPT